MGAFSVGSGKGVGGNNALDGEGGERLVADHRSLQLRQVARRQRTTPAVPTVAQHQKVEDRIAEPLESLEAGRRVELARVRERFGEEVRVLEAVVQLLLAAFLIRCQHLRSPEGSLEKRQGWRIELT